MTVAPDFLKLKTFQQSKAPVQYTYIHVYSTDVTITIEECLMCTCICTLSLLRGEAQVKSGKKEQTQGHLKKKVSDMQRQIKQTTKDIARLVMIIWCMLCWKLHIFQTLCSS